MKNKKPDLKLKAELAFRQIAVMFRYSFKNIFLFEIIYKLLIIILLKPLISRIIYMALRLQGYYIATNIEIKEFLLSPGGIILILLAIPIMLIIAFYEFSVVIIFLYYGFQKKPLKLSEGIKMGTYAFPALYSKSSFFLAIYALVIVPFLNVGISSSILPKISIPEFVMGEIGKFTGATAIIAVCALIVIPLILLKLYKTLLFAIPSMVLEHTSFGEASVRSHSLQKGSAKKVRRIILYSIVLIGAITAMILTIGEIGIITSSELITSTVTVARAAINVMASPAYLAIALACFLQLSDYPDFGNLRAAKVDRFLGKSHSVYDMLINQIKKFIEKINSIGFVVSLKRKVDESRSFTFFLTLVLITLISFTIAAVLSFNPLADQEKLVFGHRGSTVGVENTLDSVLNGASQQADYAEIDILLSKDGVPMVIHDSNLKRLAGINKNVYDLTADELGDITLKQNEYTKNISTLDELCKQTKGKIKLLIELKSHGHETTSIVDELIKVIEQNGLENEAIYHTLEYGLLEELKEKRPNFNVGYIIYGNIGVISSSILREMPADFFCFEQSVVNANLIRQCHWAEKPIYVWTVNDQMQMNSFLTLGVDGIITDFPAEAKREILNIGNRLDLELDALGSEA